MTESNMLTPEWWDKVSVDKKKSFYNYSGVTLPWDKPWNKLSQDEQDTAIILAMGMKHEN